MHAKNVTESAIKSAAAAAGVRLSYPGHAIPTRGGYRFTLKTGSTERFKRYSHVTRERICKRCHGRTYIGRIGRDEQRCPVCHGAGIETVRRTVPGRVCWHGHRDFMRELFARCPDAVLVTALATYRGRADFEQSFPDTFYQRGRGDFAWAGNQPAAALPCACEESPV